jgi:PAS domain S-box-containing protein
MKQAALGEQELQAIYEGMVDGLLIAEVHSRRFLWANPAISRMLGYAQDELARLSVDDVHPAAELPGIVELFRRMGRGECEWVEGLPCLRKDGSVCYADIGTRRLEYDGRECVAGFFRDVTERKAAEAKLRESELTLRGLVGNMPDLVLVVDENAKIRFANRDVGGARTTDLVERKGFGFLQPPYREAAEHALREAFAGRAVVHVEVLDVFDLWWSCRLAPLLDGDRVTAVMVICTDITTRKQAVESLKTEQELLRQMLELSEHDRELIAFEIHDGFAQQLTGALLQFEAAARLYRATPEEAEPAWHEGMRLLRASIEESRRLVSGLRPPVLDEFGVLPAIEHLLAEHARENGPEVEFTAPNEFPRLARPIENALFRIVQESLTNARRHSRSDRVRVEISCDHNVVRLLVWDWGVGFDPADVDQRHFGLKGIRERARLLEGRAAVHSVPGQGTRIVVELPLVGRIEKGTHLSPD